MLALLRDALDIQVWASVIEFIGTLIIVWSVARAVVTLAHVPADARRLMRARLLVAEGVLSGLSFKLAGTLLKLLFLHTWQQIFFFVVIFALRTLIRTTFAWQRRQLQLEA